MRDEIALHELELALIGLVREDHEKLRAAARRAARTLGVEHRMMEKLDAEDDAAA